jgi:LmbE family N-acetylglucosaminyl deacetylase
MANKILVIAPHPDDETLGCGGTLLRHYAEGDKIYWLIMTTITDKLGFDKKHLDIRKQEIDAVSSKYQFSITRQAKFTTTTLDTVPNNELINEVASFMNKVKPDTIYVPYRNDIHSDHTAVFDAVASCSKSFRYPFLRRIRAYETLSETEFSIRTDDGGFRPNLWVDISSYLEEKIKIMRLYKSEMGEHPFPRSEKNIRALATLRGATARLDAAEAFISIKEIM